MHITHRSFTILLAFSLLIFSAFGTVSQAAENATQQVKGVLGGSVLLPIKVSPARRVEKIEWDVIYPATGKPYRLCEFRDGKLETPDPASWFHQLEEKAAENDLIRWKNQSYWNQRNLEIEDEHKFATSVMSRYLFKHWLEMADETTLRIRNLEVGDAGIHTARLWFNAEQFEEHRFSLTLYEPVPAPEPHYTEISKTPEGCTVILKCLASGNGKFNISWERENPTRDLAGDGDGYQLSDNGQNLRVSWQKGSNDSLFTCLVSNAADQKEASFNLHKICQTDDAQSGKAGTGQYAGLPLFPQPILILLPIIAFLMLLAIIIARNGRCKEKRQDDTSTLPEEVASPPSPGIPMMTSPFLIFAPHDQMMNPPSYEDSQVHWNREGCSVRTPPPPYQFCSSEIPDPPPNMESSCCFPDHGHGEYGENGRYNGDCGNHGDCGFSGDCGGV